MIRNIKTKIAVLLLAAVVLAGLIISMGLPSATMNDIAVNGAVTTNYNITHTITSGDFDITTSGDVYEVTGDFRGAITVAENVSTVLVLNGTTRINDTSPIQLKAGSTVTLVLADGTTNTFTCDGLSTAHSAVEAGIHVPATATLIIKGQKDNSGELVTYGGTYSAGIGGGPNENSGSIVIEGGQITATARVFGNASHGAATGNAAGIGSGGGRTGAIRANTGSITICGDANVTAVSEGRGAGIGGGGSNDNAAGANGTINIYGNATVTAVGMGNGAGIGGGGTVGGSAGGGGVIAISGNPTITATSIGPGAKEGDGFGKEGTITITGGNVYTAQAAEVTNGIGDVLEMILLVEYERPPHTRLTYNVQSSSGTYYIYTATTNAASEAYLWMPLGSVFRSLTLEAYENKTDEPIKKSPDISEGITYRSELRLLNENYNYFRDIVVLTDLVEASAPGEYSLILPGDIMFTVKEEDNVVKVYYMRNRVDVEIIPVEARIDSQEGTLILNYAIPAALGEAITLEEKHMPNLSYLGFRPDSLTKSKLSATQGVTDDRIIFVYVDERPKAGSPGGGFISASLIISCINENDEEIYAQRLTSLAAGNLEIISAPKLQGYSLAEGETANREITIKSGDNEVIFRYIKLEKIDEAQTPPAQLIISCVDENGEKICVQPITSLVVGNLETIKAPELQEYSLAEDETPTQTLMVETGDNEVIFKYDKPSSTEESCKIHWIFILLAFLGGVGVMALAGSRKRKKGAL